MRPGIRIGAGGGAVALVAALALSGCGKAQTSPATVDSSSGSGGGPTFEPGGSPPPPPAPPGKPVHVTLEDWAVIPAYSSAPAGKVTFLVQNQGAAPHQFWVVRTDDAPGRLPTSGQTADLAAAGTVVAHLDVFPPDETEKLDAHLPAGHYVLLCNLPSHYMRGMRAGFSAR